MVTLKTLPQATEQEVFDHIARHLLTQAQRSETTTGGCRYHGPDGLKCAAGCLIGDDEYDPEIEGYSWLRLAEQEDLVPSQHIFLIGRLQRIHDFRSPTDWPEDLQNCALSIGLSDAVIHEVAQLDLEEA